MTQGTFLNIYFEPQLTGLFPPHEKSIPLLNKKFQVITQKTSFLAIVITHVQGST